MKASKAQDRIRKIESSSSMPEAAQKIKITREALYWWLANNNLKVVKESKLKVVSSD